jgi:hypothetical protein
VRLLLLAFAILLAGCRFEADLEVARDGSGRGTVVVIDPPPAATVDDAARQLRRAGFTVTKAWAPSPDRIAAEVAWKDFSGVFLRRVVNGDGSVTLDFGPIDQGRLTVRVPGRIDANDTSGQVRGRDVAIFTGGRARLTYASASPWPWIVLALGATLLLGLATLGIRLARRRPPALDSPLPDGKNQA